MVQRWNESGLDGLASQPKATRSRTVTPRQQAAVLDLLDHPEKAGVNSWTARSLHGYQTRENIALLGYSTLVRLIHESCYAPRFS